MLAQFNLSPLFHQILRICVQDQNWGKCAKNRSLIKTQFLLSFKKYLVQEGKQMKGNYSSLILSMKHWSWELEAVSAWLLAGPVVQWDFYAGEERMVPPATQKFIENAQDLHFDVVGDKLHGFHIFFMWVVYIFTATFRPWSCFIFLCTEDTPSKTD